MKHSLSFILGSLWLTGCAAVGPNYETPEPLLPEQFIGATTNPPESEASTPTPIENVAWWEALGDPILTKYVNHAVRQNLDLQVAAARVREARALRGVAASKFYPDVTVGGDIREIRSSENGQVNLGKLNDLGFADVETSLYQVGFDAQWEIDIFGGTRRSVESADAQLGATAEVQHDILLTVVAEVARNYTELRGAQRRLEIAEKNIRIQSDTLLLVSNKNRVGIVPELDVQQARTQLKTSESRVPGLRASIQSAAFRLAVLTGRQPSALLDELLVSRPIPAPPDMVPVGLPSELLRRRPDIRQAERKLHAATADIGVVTADLYPRFFLTGAAGFESVSFSDLFDAKSGVFSIGPSIRWPLFQGGRIRSNIHASEARRDASYAQFQHTVLIAVEDVERSLIRYAEEQLEQKSLSQAVTAGQRTVELASVLYDKGLVDFLTVLDAERTLRDVEDQLVLSETAVTLNVIALYKALGGGWNAQVPDV